MLGPILQGPVGWLLLAALVIMGLRFFGLCDRAARLERELLLIKRSVSALVFDAATRATVPEYRQALERLVNELGKNPW